MSRSRASERDRARRRLLGLTTLAGVAAAGAVGGLCVGLAPAHAAAPGLVPRDGGVRQDPSRGGFVGDSPQGPPVATSGSS